MSKTDIIPIAQCVNRRVYKVRTRNLYKCCVFDAAEGAFIGIREKFNDLFLDSEDHHDKGPPFGTATPYEDTEIDLPEDIDLRTREPSVDTVTGRLVAFDTPVRSGGRGWHFVDTGESSFDIRPASYAYKPLFDWLCSDASGNGEEHAEATRAIAKEEEKAV